MSRFALVGPLVALEGPKQPHNSHMSWTGSDDQRLKKAILMQN